MTMNPAERDALNRKRLESRDFDKNFLVSAGAGAGKTYTTVERVFNMLCDESSGIQPQDIVMITFTIRAANEMKTRLSEKLRTELEKCKDPGKQKKLASLLGNLPEMQISTIHSFCRRILNDYPLESGVGFAPKFESEDGDLKSSALTVWMEKAWQEGRFHECERLGIRKETAMKNLKNLSGFPTVVPQFEDPDSERNHAEYDLVMKECRRLVQAFSDSMGDTDPDLLHYLIRDAVLAGEELTDSQAIGVVRRIAKKIDDLNWWMGKTSKKGAKGACETLQTLMDKPFGYVATDEELKAMSQVLETGNGLSGEERRGRILENIGLLPEGYREAAWIANDLPDPESVKELPEKIDRMIHGYVTKELYRLCGEYEQERHEKHIVTLSDMLVRSAALVHEHPEVRQKLHDRYKVFFVDEYQDTNPIQTELIFAIVADEYHRDWHLSVPGPGRLFLVGDAKQGIYRFTGADIALWNEAKEVIRRTGGEVVSLSKNYRSTPQVCEAVTQVFGPGGKLQMAEDGYQVEFQEMVANREPGPDGIYHHVIPCYENGRTPGQDDGDVTLLDPFDEAAEQVALYIRDRVDRDGKEYGDFLVLSFYREKHDQYSEMFRKYKIPVKYDGVLHMSAYRPIKLLNLRVQAVCHPFDERLSIRVLCECGDVLPQEWDLFRMNLKRLPAETNLTKYRDPRSLMDHVEEMQKLLPDTDMNRNIFKALNMLNDDRIRSQHLSPSAFLDELAEKSEGLFREEYDAEEYQNQYAALRHIIDSIRGMNPQHFDEMAELLQAMVDGDLDRMPTVRADDNYVRLMNLHKVKGLEGKIVIYLPDRIPQARADQYILRDGTATKGWFPLKPEGNGNTYNPPDWKEYSAKELAYQKAERTRLRYVALTRAADEVHIFDFLVDEKSKARKEPSWKGFEAIGETVTELKPDEDETDRDREDEKYETVRAEREEVLSGLKAVKEKHSARKTPSTADREYGESGNLQVQDADDVGLEDTQDPEELQGGKDWGSAVHRTAELVVLDGSFTAESVWISARQAVTEEFDSELLSAQERKNLLLPEDKVSLDEIREWLAEQIAKKLAFMMSVDSPFRKELENAEIHTELPFVISVSPTDGEVYFRLANLMDVPDGRRLEAQGKIDLALRYPDGSWVIKDYKTDRMLPSDLGSRENFIARLKRQYGKQMEIYKTVLEYLTGETVRETSLLSV